MFRSYTAPALLTLLLTLTGPLTGQLTISELVSTNNLVTDEDGDYPDWIELRNAGPALNLTGYHLSDDPDDSTKWAFGNVNLPAGGYWVIYASGKDRPVPPPARPHANFRISSAGETVYLFSPSGQLVDSLGSYGLRLGLSVGRPAATPEQRHYFDRPTPGQANDAPGYAQLTPGRVAFSHPGGPTDPLELTLTAPAGTTIRYTTDARTPTVNDPEYETPLPIDSTTTVSAALFAPGALPSPTTRATFLVGLDHTVDVVSLTTDPANFFDADHGIYEEPNIRSGREVPVQFGFFPRGAEDQWVLADMGTSIHGGYSRRFDQRSLALFARERYGTEAIDYRFFPQRSYTTYRHLVLRNSGQDWMYTMLRDATLTGLMAGSGVDYTAHRPAVVYLNGQYRGLYNLREKVNEDFLATRHGIDPDAIDILEKDGEVIEGDGADYRALMDFVAASDLSIRENYEYVTERIDLENYLRYMVAQIYYNNRDWPGNNLKYWRSPELDNKWRWILFDTDFGAALWDRDAWIRNTLGYALSEQHDGFSNPPWSTLLLRRMVEQPAFRERFINQFADEMNRRFLPERTQDSIDRNAARIAAEIPRAYARWDGPHEWSAEVEQMKRFFRLRPGRMKELLREQFGLSAMHSLRILNNEPERGYVRVNTLDVAEGDWSGEYFQGVPVPVTAVPHAGYRFVRWEVDGSGSDTTVSVLLDAPRTYRAVFAEVLDPDFQSVLRGDLRMIREVRWGPNPSAGSLTLAFLLSDRTRVRAEIFTTDGRAVTTLLNAELDAGQHDLTLNAGDLPAGAYLFRLSEEGGGSAVTAWVKN